MCFSHAFHISKSCETLQSKTHMDHNNKNDRNLFTEDYVILCHGHSWFNKWDLFKFNNKMRNIEVRKSRFYVKFHTCDFADVKIVWGSFL